MRLRQAIHELITHLELTPAEQAQASRQHVHLRDGLSRTLILDPRYNTFLTGSYSRSTAIRPLNDIDLFCVLTRTPDTGPHLTPTAALTRVKTALDAMYHGKTAIRQNRSVHIDFSTTGIGYDVVPAFVDPDFAANEVFLIPDKATGRWIRSNPRVHQDLSVQANAATDGELKPLTKALKYWNRRLPRDRQLRSFHLEVMAWSALTAPPDSRADGLLHLFEALATRIQHPTPDPAHLGGDLDEDLTPDDRRAARRELENAAAHIRRAIDLDAAGAADAAHTLLRSLFGEAYPVGGA